MAIQQLNELVQKHSYQTNEPPSDDVADVHFFRVKQVGELTAEELATAIRENEKGYYQDMSIETLMRGPSYIHLGAWIGDQGIALQLIGLGQLLGLWDAVTPSKLGITGPDAAEMAGMGFVMAAPTTEGQKILENAGGLAADSL